MDEITKAVMNGDSMEVGAQRELLRASIVRQIFCPYCGHVLDVSNSILIDATDYGGKMHILHDWEYDALLEAHKTPEGLAAALTYSKIDVLDGRVLFPRKPARARRR